MDRASKVLRRSSVRLKSLGAGHSDLNMVISELKDLRVATKAFMTAQNSASQDMVKWATCDENRAIQDIMSQLGELNSMWTDVQKEFIEQLKCFKNHFELILEGERQLDVAQNQLANCEQTEHRIRKELKRASKKATEEELNNLEIKLSQAERAKYLAQLEVVELAHKNEAVKVVRLKDGLLKLSDAYVELANKCAIIFEAQKEVSHYLPDVHSRDMNELKYTGSGACKQAVAKAHDRVQQYKRHNYRLVPSIIEDPPPPYTPYNPTGRPTRQPSHHRSGTNNRQPPHHHVPPPWDHHQDIIQPVNRHDITVSQLVDHHHRSDITVVQPPVNRHDITVSPDYPVDLQMSPSYPVDHHRSDVTASPSYQQVDHHNRHDITVSPSYLARPDMTGGGDDLPPSYLVRPDLTSGGEMPPSYLVNRLSDSYPPRYQVQPGAPPLSDDYEEELSGAVGAARIM